MKKNLFLLILTAVVLWLAAPSPSAAQDPIPKKTARGGAAKKSGQKKQAKLPAVQKTVTPGKKTAPAETVKKKLWLTEPTKVGNSVEERYDVNHDGRLDARENKALLRDKMMIISARGKTKVETAADREYDLDHDGYVDAKESIYLKDDLSQRMT